MKEIMFEFKHIKNLFDRYIESPKEWDEDLYQELNTLARHIEERMKGCTKQ